MSELVLSSIESLTTDWLCRVLNDGDIENFSSQRLEGEGYNSRLYRLNINSNSADTPTSLILKLATDNEIFTKLLSGTALYREVLSYALLGEHLGDLIPKIYLAEIDEGREQITLLMEDLGEIPHKPFRENLENSLIAIKNIASIHARFWQPDKVLTDTLMPLSGTLPQEEIITSNISKYRTRFIFIS